MKNRNIFKSVISILLTFVLIISMCSISTLASTDASITEETSTTETPNVINDKDSEYQYREVFVQTNTNDSTIDTTLEIQEAGSGGFLSFTPTVEDLTEINVTEQKEDSISIKWNSLEEISGYDLYYRQTGDDVYRYIYSTTSTEAKIGNLLAGTHYDFKVAAYAEANEIKYEGKGIEVTSFTTPGYIGKISITRSSDVIGFKWQKNGNVTGYQVERNYYASDGFELCATIEDPDVTEYDDEDVENGRGYFYKVRAYIEDNGEMYYGPYSYFQGVAGLYAAVYTSIKTQLRRVTLSWESSPLAEGYTVFYATEKNGPYDSMGDYTGNYLNTPRLKANQLYYIRVTPYRYVGDVKVYGTYKTAKVTCSPKAYAVDVGDTYIEVSIDMQHMWQYIDGELVNESDVVTGLAGGSRATPRGCYKILQRQSPCVLVGDDYRTTVTFWLGFTYSGCGLHDATWRGSFGGSIYTYDGSHGCVNMPYGQIQAVYNEASTGDYVVVY